MKSHISLDWKGLQQKNKKGKISLWRFCIMQKETQKQFLSEIFVLVIHSFERLAGLGSKEETIVNLQHPYLTVN